MSAYAYNTLTQDGATLIAQATAANPIVFVASKSKASAATDADALAGKPLSWYDGKSGAIAACSAYVTQDGVPVARVVASYSNAGSTQIAKSVCITARLASQTDADAVVFAAISDPDATIELPGSGSIVRVVEFPFNFAINATNTVTVTPGAAASLADLDRFVSLHSAANPNVGDTQTILGEKTFANDVYFNGDVSAGTIECYDLSVVSNGSISAEKNISAGGKITAGGNVTAGGNLKVEGSSEFSDDVEISTGDLTLLIGSVVATGGDVECNRVICESATSTITVGSGQTRIRLNASGGLITAKKVHADEIAGVLPYPDAAGHEPPIGGYAFISVTKSSPFEVAIGQTFEGATETIQTACYFSQSATGPHFGVKQGYTSLGGDYVACQDAYSGTDTTCYFLAQRIS